MYKIFKKSVLCLLLLCLTCIVFNSCEKKDKQLYFTINTEVGAITKNSASCIVRLVAERGSEDVYKKSHFVSLMWNDKGYPTPDLSGHIGSGTGNRNESQYTCQMTNLKHNTTYYVQGFVIFGIMPIVNTTENEIKYGAVVTFKTPSE